MRKLPLFLLQKGFRYLDRISPLLATPEACGGSESDEYIRLIEEKVEKVNKTALPDADIIWVDSDAVIDGQGAVHCTAIAVPMVRQQTYADAIDPLTTP